MNNMNFFYFTIGKIIFKAGRPGNIWERKYVWMPLIKYLDYDWKCGVGFYCLGFALEIHKDNYLT